MKIFTALEFNSTIIGVNKKKKTEKYLFDFKSDDKSRGYVHLKIPHTYVDYLSVKGSVTLIFFII